MTLLLPNQPDLKPGSKGAEVGNWQRFLNDQAFRDKAGDPLRVDEDFGPRTGYATAAFQTHYGLLANAIVGKTTRAVAVPLGFVEFVQAKGYTQHYPSSSRTISLVVVHTMECLETPEAAVNVALWFAGRTAYPPPRASAHYCLSDVSTVQCVREADMAWHATRANGRSIGIEHAGYARQTAEQWHDEYSSKLLARSARLVADLCRRYAIPVRKLGPEELRAGEAGICGHVDVTNAFDGGVGHWDPGPNFIWAEYLEAIQRHLDANGIGP